MHKKTASPQTRHRTVVLTHNPPCSLADRVWINTIWEEQRANRPSCPSLLLRTSISSPLLSSLLQDVSSLVPPSLPSPPTSSSPPLFLTSASQLFTFPTLSSHSSSSSVRSINQSASQPEGFSHFLHVFISRLFPYGYFFNSFKPLAPPLPLPSFSSPSIYSPHTPPHSFLISPLSSLVFLPASQIANSHLPLPPVQL